MLKVASDREWERGDPSPEIAGMVGSPEIGRSTRGYLSFFINRRWINSRLLAWAVEEAYHGLLKQGKHPVAVINISLPSWEVDANVHPTKTEVKFRNERVIFGSVQKAVRRALVGMATIPRIEEVAATYKAASVEQRSLWTSSPAIQTGVGSTVAALPLLRVVGQLLNLYIIAEGPDGLYLIDQHAAHERILFEKILGRGSVAVEVQGLLEPETLEVSPRQDEVLSGCYQELAEFGFSIEPFGPRTFLVRAVPALLHDKDWAGVLKELLDCPSAGDKSDWRERVAISIACHSAVRAGQTLAQDEMRKLVRGLEQASLPYTCPHGRPTMIQITSERLEREFGRS